LAEGRDLTVSPTFGERGPLTGGLKHLERWAEDRMQVRAESRPDLPSVAGRTQVAGYDGDGHPRLYLGASLPKDYRRHPQPVNFEVLAREASSAPPPEGATVVGSLHLEPTADGGVWRPRSSTCPARQASSRSCFSTPHLNATHSGMGQGFEVVLEVPRPVDERPLNDIPPRRPIGDARSNTRAMLLPARARATATYSSSAGATRLASSARRLRRARWKSRSTASTSTPQRQSRPRPPTKFASG